MVDLQRRVSLDGDGVSLACRFRDALGFPFLLCLFGALLLGWLLALALGATSMYDTMHEAVGVHRGAHGLVPSRVERAATDRSLSAYLRGAGSSPQCRHLVAAVISRLAFGSQAFWYGIRLSGWSGA